MIGKVRSKEMSCPVCHKPFIQVERVGIFCQDHPKVHPDRFFIDLFWLGKRIKIYSDKVGKVLDSYTRAFDILSDINSELQEKTFDPSKYVRQEQEKFLLKKQLDQFFLLKKKAIAPSYLPNYGAMRSAVKEFFKNMDLRDLRKLDIFNFKEFIEGKGFKNKTVKNYLDFLRVFLKYCYDLEIIDRVPTFPKIEVEEAKFRWLDQENQVSLFEYVPDLDKPIVSFLMLHGCRPGEARALKVKDVDLKRNCINISATWSGKIYREKRKGKRAKSYSVCIHDEMRNWIEMRVKECLPEAFLFINPRTGQPYSKSKFQRIWDTVREKAKISKGLRFYDATRHSFASQLVNAGIPLNEVSEMMGHSTIEMTRKYAHLDLNSLRTNLKKLSLKKVVTVPGVSLDGEVQKIAIKNQ